MIVRALERAEGVGHTVQPDPGGDDRVGVDLARRRSLPGPSRSASRLPSEENVMRICLVTATIGVIASSSISPLTSKMWVYHGDS